MAEYVIRRMDVDDLDAVCQHRAAMFMEAARPCEAVDAMREPFREWLQPKLKDGSYLGWAVDHEGAVVGGAGLILLDWPPHPLHPSEAHRGYLLNVWVDPPHRGKGLAKRLVQATYKGARELGISYLVLHASKLGRPVYEGLGWRQTDEMSLLLDDGLAVPERGPSSL
jgi:GNAT superfamily N-acetyltransferase